MCMTDIEEFKLILRKLMKDRGQSAMIYAFMKNEQVRMLFMS